MAEQGRKLRDGAGAAGGADASCLCGPQRSAIRRALPREPEVPGFNYCFMLNLSPATLTLKRMHVLFFSMIKRKKR